MNMVLADVHVTVPMARFDATTWQRFFYTVRRMCHQLIDSASGHKEKVAEQLKQSMKCFHLDSIMLCHGL
jgi:hypothetical protein